MIDLKVIFVFALCVCTVVCDDNKEFMDHRERVYFKNFPCSEPQPRVFYLRDLMDEKEYYKDYKKNLQNIYPIGTVLHACQNTGCCSRYNERCDAMDEDDVDLTFMAIHGNSSKYFSITAKNHTLCGCQEISKKFIK